MYVIRVNMCVHIGSTHVHEGQRTNLAIASSGTVYLVFVQIWTLLVSPRELPISAS